MYIQRNYLPLKANSNNSAPLYPLSLLEAWTLLVIKVCQLLSERESQSAMIICRVCARRFFQFLEMFINNKKWRSTQRLVRLNQNMALHLKKNTWVQWKHLTPERSIDLCLQTFPKLLLLFAPKVTRSYKYSECIANLKLPVDTFYRESRSGINVAKRNITTGLFGLLKSYTQRNYLPLKCTFKEIISP